MRTVLIAAGGTGGHVFPGLAVAKALQQQQINVVWLGTQQGLDATLVPAAKLPFYPIAIKGLRGKGKKALLLAPFKILAAIIDAMRIIRRTRADVVLGMGGYVSGPAGIAAKLLRKPLLIHEQNAVAGFTNRCLAKIANKVLQAFPDSFRAVKNAITVGNPVRPELFQLPAHTTPNKPLHVLVIGGSQGAKVINQVMPQVVQRMGDSITVWQQTGSKLFTQTQQAYGDTAVKLTPFIDDISQAYQWADVIICRAGALTIAEVSAAGLAAIFIPFAAATDDHQSANARYVTEQGGGLLLPQAELSPERLCQLLTGLTPAKIQTFSSTLKTLARPDATARITEEILHEFS